MSKSLLKKLVMNLVIMLLIVTLVLIMLEVRRKHNGVLNDKIIRRNEVVMTKVGNELKEIQTIADSLARKLSNGEISKSLIIEEIQRLTLANPKISGLGVFYKPYQFDPDTKLYGPYFHKKSGGYQLSMVEDHYDYSADPVKGVWYDKSINKQSPGWIEPYYGNVSQDMLADYTVCFYHSRDSGREDPLGVIVINYSLSDVNYVVHSVRPDMGYDFILSEKGNIISHPSAEFTDEYQALGTVAARLVKEKRISSQTRSQLLELEEMSRQKVSGTIRYNDLIVNGPVLAYSRVFPLTNWLLVSVIPLGDGTVLLFMKIIAGLVIIWLLFNLIACLHAKKNWAVVRIFITTGAFILLGLIIYQTAFIILDRQDSLNNGMMRTRKMTDIHAEKLVGEFRTLETLAQEIAGKLSHAKFRGTDLEDMLEEMALANPELLGIGIFYEPYRFAPDQRLKSVYYMNDCRDFVPVEYDYTQYDWYQTPLAEGGTWLEPYYGEASRTTLVEYSLPFYLDEDHKIPGGVICINFSYDRIARQIKCFEMDAGYGYILSKKGFFISFPIEEYAQRVLSVDNLEDLMNIPDKTRVKLLELSQLAEENRDGMLMMPDIFTHQLSWVITRQIGDTGYLFVSSFIIKEITRNNELIRRRIMKLVIYVVLFLTLLTAFALNIPHAGPREYWILSIVFSLCLCCGIGTIWFLKLTYPSSIEMDKQKLQNNKNIYHLEKMVSLDTLSKREDAPVFIPTGFYIQSMNFTNSSDVFLTGYIWQKYAHALAESHPDISREAPIFPEAIDANSGNIMVKKYEREEKDETSIGWYFETTLRQSFDYTQFPFDHKHVWIRVWHHDFYKNIILIPDLDGYRMMLPAFLPGIDNDMVLSGWNMEKSFFSYQFKSYSSNFGISDYDGANNFPELYFTMVIHRNFMDPFVSNLLPFLVIACIIFALFFMIHSYKEQKHKIDYNFSIILGTCAGLFFTIVITHSQLRDLIRVRNILYLEYFYLILYLLIIVLVINSFIFSSKYEIRLIKYKDNLVFKLLYWPVLLIYLFVTTVLVFY